MSTLMVYLTGTIIQLTGTPATSGRIFQATNIESIRKFLANYANVYVTSQSHGFCVHVLILLSESRMDYQIFGLLTKYISRLGPDVIMLECS